MHTVPVRVQRLPNGVGLPLPTYQSKGAAGMDLVAANGIVIGAGKTSIVETGLRMVVPDGFEIQIRSRGGLASKGIFVTNGPGTVDADYRGEIMVLLTNSTDKDFLVCRGDRIAQAVIAPVTIGNLIEVESIDTNETERGEGRLSSTGLR